MTWMTANKCDKFRIEHLEYHLFSSFLNGLNNTLHDGIILIGC